MTKPALPFWAAAEEAGQIDEPPAVKQNRGTNAGEPEAAQYRNAISSKVWKWLRGLQGGYADIIVGTAGEVTSRDATHTVADFVAAIVNGDHVHFRTGTHALGQNEDITELDIKITFDEDAILDDGTDRTFTVSGARAQIGPGRFTGFTAGDIIISGADSIFWGIDLDRSFVTLSNDSQGFFSGPEGGIVLTGNQQITLPVDPVADTDAANKGWVLGTKGSTVRQTVLEGEVDANGRANFLADGGGLDVDINATTGPSLKLSFAAGFTGQGEVNHHSEVVADVVSAWTIPDVAQTNYLYVDRDPSTGALTYAEIQTVPTYGYAHPGGPATDDHSFLIHEMKMYRYTGAVWEEKQRIFLGEVDGDGAAGIAAGPFTYAIRGEGEFTNGAALATSTKYSFNAYLGIDRPGDLELIYECLTAENGYSIGDNYRMVDASHGVWSEGLVIGFSTYGGAGSTIIPKGGGALAAMVITRWQGHLRFSRGW